MKEMYQTLRRLEDARGTMAYHLHLFGDHLAEREGYRHHRGMDAVHFYLVGKYGWLPSVVRSLNTDDLCFLLDEEKQGWVIPKDARE